MKQIVVGVFERYEVAQQAAARLAERGFPSEAVHVTESQPGDLDHGLSDTSAAPRYGEHRGVLESIRGFFAEVFGTDHESHEGHSHLGEYAEAVRRGGAVVSVDAEDDPRVNTAREVLQDVGAVDIEEKVAEWREQGWSGELTSEEFARTSAAGELGTHAAPGTAAAGDTRTTDGTGLDTRAARTARTAGSVGLPEDSVGMRASQAGREAGREDVIPVLKEELEVGKRTVSKGGVRVYSRVVEQPVEERLELREERAKIERRPVDRPASQADLGAAFQERSVEVREMAETPVVIKTAKVVEEVVVGKEATERTETVRDAVRSTEVQIDRLEGGGSARTQRAYDDFADDFRADWQSNYAASGGAYEDYEPAYRYGHGLGSESRYAGRAWDDIEPDVRSDWERRHPGSAWERFKAAVRHAWERVTG